MSKNKKEITVGSTLTLSSSVIVVRIRAEAQEELNKIPKKRRREILDKAIEISKERGRPYDVTREDILEAIAT